MVRRLSIFDLIGIIVLAVSVNKPSGYGCLFLIVCFKYAWLLVCRNDIKNINEATNPSAVFVGLLLTNYAVKLKAPINSEFEKKQLIVDPLGGIWVHDLRENVYSEISLSRFNDIILKEKEYKTTEEIVAQAIKRSWQDEDNFDDDYDAEELV